MADITKHDKEVAKKICLELDCYYEDDNEKKLVLSHHVRKVAKILAKERAARIRKLEKQVKSAQRYVGMGGNQCQR